MKILPGRRRIALVAASAAITKWAYARRRTAPPAGAGTADWAPLASPARPAVADAREPTPPPAEGAPWVDPVAGACPASHPVKGNGSSRIYHVPGGRFYDQTIPERCYRDAAAAEADGMRASKR